MADPLFDLDVNTTQPVRVPRARCGARTRRATVVLHVDRARSSASRGTSRSTRTTRSRRSTSTASPSTRPSSCTSCTTSVYGLPATRGAAHERVRAAPAPARRLPGLPPDLRAGARSPTSRSPCSATARRSATASTSTTSSSACCSRARSPRRRGEIFNVGNDEHLSLRRDRRRGRRGGRLGPGRARRRGRPTATRSTSARTSATRRRRSACSGWEPRDRLRRRDRAHARVLPRAPAAGTCDARRRRDPRPRRRPRPAGRGARARALRRRSTASCARARTCSAPRLDAFEAEFAAFAGRRHAVGGRVGHRGAAPRAGRARRRARRRGDRPRDDRGADRRRGVRGGRACRCSSTSTPTPRRIDAAAAAAAVTDRTRAGDPGAPLRAAGRSARPRRAGASRTRPRPTARSTRAAGVGRGAYSFYPTKNLGGIGDGGAVVTDDDDARGDAAPAARARARPTTTCTP